MKIKTTLFIHYVKDSWDAVGKYVPFPFKWEKNSSYIYVCSQEVELDVPDNFDPTIQQIASLEDQKAEATKAFHLSVARINLQISKLQALEYTA